jgi:hypothetical protein
MVKSDDGLACHHCLSHPFAVLRQRRASAIETFGAGADAERSLKQGLGVATPRQLVNQLSSYDMLPSIEDIGAKAGNLASSW